MNARPLCALLVLSLGLCRATALHAQVSSQPAPASATVLSVPVTNFIHARIRAEGRRGIRDTTGARAETWAVAAPLPLEGDRLRAQAIYLTGREWCGTSGCDLLIVTEDSAGTVRLVGDVGLVQLPIRVLTTSHAGLPDLAGTVFGGGEMRPHLVRLRYDGKHYPDDTNWLPEVPARRGGQALLTDTMPETRIWPPAAPGKTAQRCIVVTRTTFGPMYSYRPCSTTR